MRILLDKISVFTWERVTEVNVYVQDGLHNFDDDVNIVTVYIPRFAAYTFSAFFFSSVREQSSHEFTVYVMFRTVYLLFITVYVLFTY